MPGGAPHRNCWGFMNRMVRPVSKPGNNQQVVYKWHKREHAIKVQWIAIPNALVAFLHGPYEGKRHDSGILCESGFVKFLEEYSISPNGEVMCKYGDSAYPFRPQLQAPFRGANITTDEQLWNMRKGSCTISVEWLLGDIPDYFNFIDFRMNPKGQVGSVRKCALFARKCLHGSLTSGYF